jgi:DNA polymerase-3 subunit alpha
VTVAPNDFVHLHLHSEFSLLDGLGRINDLAEQGSALGFDAMTTGRCTGP